MRIEAARGRRPQSHRSKPIRSWLQMNEREGRWKAREAPVWPWRRYVAAKFKCPYLCKVEMSVVVVRWEFARTGHFNFALTRHVAAKFKCPYLCKVEMSVVVVRWEFARTGHFNFALTRHVAAKR